MATPQPGYPQYGQPSPAQNQEEYDHSQQPEYEDNTNSSQAPVTSAAARKKRHYAGQAYDFGGGANSALGGQQIGGAPNPGPYPLPPGASNSPYGQQAQPQQPGYNQPGYGDGQPSPGVPSYGQSPGVGGYQPPDQGYPAQVPPSAPIGVGGLTQGMNNMSMGGQPQHRPQHIQQRVQLNQLYPTDLLNQPFIVSELDLPPPPVILPPNVRQL